MNFAGVFCPVTAFTIKSFKLSLFLVCYYIYSEYYYQTKLLQVAAGSFMLLFICR